MLSTKVGKWGVFLEELLSLLSGHRCAIDYNYHSLKMSLSLSGAPLLVLPVRSERKSVRPCQPSFCIARAPLCVPIWRKTVLRYMNPRTRLTEEWKKGSLGGLETKILVVSSAGRLVGSWSTACEQHIGIFVFHVRLYSSSFYGESMVL